MDSVVALFCVFWLYDNDHPVAATAASIMYLLTEIGRLIESIT